MGCSLQNVLLCETPVTMSKIPDLVEVGDIQGYIQFHCMASAPVTATMLIICTRERLYLVHRGQWQQMIGR